MILALAPAAVFSATDASATNQAVALPDGLRVVTCGHSFHTWVAPILSDLAEKAGIKGHQTVALSYIGGSRVIQHWDVPAEKNEAIQALKTGKVDVLTLSPIWLPDDGIEKFVRLGLEYNPNLRITIQEFWLPNDTYHPVYPLESKKYVDHNATTIPELKKQNDLYRKDVENFVRDLNQRLGKTAVFVVPVGEAATALREKIISGTTARPLRVQWALFTDSWGHPAAPLRILAAYCHYAVIYRRSPIGLPMPQEFLQNKEYASPKLNLLLQQLAWEAVTQNPLSGVTEAAK